MKSPKKKGIFKKAIILVMAVYAVVSLVEMQIEIADKKSQLDILLTEYEEKRIENKELERQLIQSDEQEYLEKKAREQEYIYPRERVFVDISGS